MVVVVATKGVMVRVRVTAGQRELWLQAAGGKRRLSEWIRERCDAALTERDGTGSSVERVSAEGRDADDVREAAGSIPAPLEPSRSVSAVSFARPGAKVKCEDPEHGRKGWKCRTCREMF